MHAAWLGGVLGLLLLTSPALANSPKTPSSVWVVNGQRMTVWGQQPSGSSQIIRNAYPAIYYTTGIAPNQRMNVEGPYGPATLVGVAARSHHAAAQPTSPSQPSHTVTTAPPAAPQASATHSPFSSAARGGGGGLGCGATPCVEQNHASSLRLMHREMAAATTLAQRNFYAAYYAPILRSQEAFIQRRREAEVERAKWRPYRFRY